MPWCLKTNTRARDIRLEPEIKLSLPLKTKKKGKTEFAEWPVK